MTPTADREGPAVTPYLGLALGVVAVSFGAIFARMAGELEYLQIDNVAFLQAVLSQSAG